ncbi:hydrolase [Mycolicibacterium cyprinidarum]|nr:hydrolase [Mycolicibacterium sp. NGTWS1803]
MTPVTPVTVGLFAVLAHCSPNSLRCSATMLQMNDMSFLELHGDRVAYRDVGSGDEVLLLIHGMAGSSETWRAVVPQLAKKYRVIAPDLLGHGQSAKPRSDYSLGAFAVLLRDLLDELGVSRVTIVGQSLGGGVAMQFVYQHPDYCQRLVLISSGGLGPDVGRTLRLLSAPGAELIMPVIAPPPVVRAGNKVRAWLSAASIQSPRGAEMWSAYSSLADRQTRQAFLRTLRSVVDYHGQAVSALNRLHLTSELPAMVIWGDQDRIIPVEHGYAFYDAALKHAGPGCRLEVLPGVGHFPQVERPRDVVDLLDDFIATTSQSTQAAMPVAQHSTR